MPNEAQFVMRPGHADDRAFVFSSWLKSYRDSMPLVWNGTYYAGQHSLIERLLDDAQTQVVVASPIDDDLTILGWAVRSKPSTLRALHYVYVKEAFRRMGIGASLAGEFQVATHMTRYGQLALKGRPVVYNPYLLMRGTADR